MSSHAVALLGHSPRINTWLNPILLLLWTYMSTSSYDWRKCPTVPISPILNEWPLTSDQPLILPNSHFLSQFVLLGMVSYLCHSSRISRGPHPSPQWQTYAFIGDLGSSFTEKIQPIIRDFMEGPPPNLPTYLFLYLLTRMLPFIPITWDALSSFPREYVYHVDLCTLTMGKKYIGHPM